VQTLDISRSALYHFDNIRFCSGMGTMRQRRRAAGAGSADKLDLGSIFNAALQNVSDKRTEINALDGANGNHGDNMVHNLQVITQAIQSQKGTPSKQLRAAAEQLQAGGKGSTGQYYAQGLAQAADQFQGKRSLNQNDIGSLLQSVMGNVPVKPSANMKPRPQGDPLASLLGGMMGGGAPQAAPQQPASGGGDPMAALLGGLMGGQPAQPQSSQAGGDPLASLLGAALGGGGAPGSQMPAGGGDPLAALLGAAMGQSQPPPPQSGANVLNALMGMSQMGTQSAPQQGSGGLDLGDLLTAGMAFMQAKQQGADNMQAGMQALMAGLAGGQMNPLQAGSPQAAAGGLIAQSLLQAALGGRK
jgi:hypothetical protein